MASMTYDEFDLGSKIFGSGTVTEAHIVNAAGLFNDFNPLHVNEEAALKSIFGKRIAHGPLIVGIMLGVIGNSIAGTGIADLETTFRFRSPVFIGDTLTYTWEVIERMNKEKYGGGIVTFQGTATNQRQQLVVEATNKVLITNLVPAWAVGR